LGGGARLPDVTEGMMTAEAVCLPLDGNLLRTERDPALAYDGGGIPDDDDYVLCLVLRDDLRDWLNEHVGNCKQRWSEHGVEFVFERQSEADGFCGFLEGLGSASEKTAVRRRAGPPGGAALRPGQAGVSR
jgi:hypothetical protein